MTNYQDTMITFFKELWQLIKMMFASNPNEYNELELVGMNKFPFKGYKYMMWCGKIIYRLDDESPELSIRSKTHETIHLKQAQVKGSWIKYYWRYVCEWIKGNPIVHPASSAYYTIPFEMEAYANEDNPDYPLNYDGRYLHCYNIKNRKEIYRKYGNSYAWKKYIKTIEKVAE